VVHPFRVAGIDQREQLRAGALLVSDSGWQPAHGGFLGRDRLKLDERCAGFIGVRDTGGARLLW
jgi:hypothetical protein